MLALGAWGVHAPPPPPPVALRATSVLLFLRSAARPGPAAPPAAYRIQLDERVWTVRTAAGRARVVPGEPDAADAGLRTDPETLNLLLADPAALDATVRAGRATVTGDWAALRRLLAAVAGPAADGGSATAARRAAVAVPARTARSRTPSQ